MLHRSTLHRIASLAFVLTFASVGCSPKDVLTAAAVGDTKQVAALLDAGADIESRDAKGLRPLHKAAENGEVETVTLLIERGADVNAGDKDGRTPMIRAAKKGRYDVIVALLASPNIKPDAQGEDGQAALHAAATNGHLDICKALVAAGVLLDLKDDKEWTPLHKAALEMEVEAAEFLIKSGADPQAMTMTNRIPWHVAGQSDDAAPMREMLEKNGGAPLMDIRIPGF